MKNNKKDNKKINEKRYLQGLCRNCKNNTIPGKYHCNECRQKMSDKQREKRQNRRKNNLCMQCGIKTPNSYCDDCKEKTREIKLQSKKKQTLIRKSNNLCTSCSNYSGEHVLCCSCRKKGKDKYDSKKENNLCLSCGTKNENENSTLYCNECLINRNKSSKINYQKKRDLNLCVSCSSQTQNKSLCEKCLDKIKIKRRKIKENVLLAYGEKCNCCGESTKEFLHIDHINGNGRKHLKEIKMDFYQWLIKNNFPSEFQILCANCNMCKFRYKVCSHIRKLSNNEIDEIKNKKLSCFEQYGGPICKCCGETNIEFLEMDHIENNGNEHRKKDKKSCNLYSWLKSNNYPKGFQVLCCNCNWGKRFLGICPHCK